MTLEELYRQERENSWDDYKFAAELSLYHAHKIDKNVPLTFSEAVWAAGKSL